MQYCFYMLFNLVSHIFLLSLNFTLNTEKIKKCWIIKLFLKFARFKLIFFSMDQSTSSHQCVYIIIWYLVELVIIRNNVPVISTGIWGSPKNFLLSVTALMLSWINLSMVCLSVSSSANIRIPEIRQTRHNVKELF